MPIRAYANPILPGFHPDPSICRVGADFYLAVSSFQWFPGVPIHHSRDLTHWRLIGHALTRVSQLDLSAAPSSGGIYAPTLRWHAGHFYLITTDATGRGNFLVTAQDPAGPWSEPVPVAVGGIDPSLFFDADGRVYVQSTGKGEGIEQAELNLATGALLAPPRLIWAGTGGRYPEGAHMRFRAGRYYLMIAEGGTELGHMVTVARSDSPWGPFEPCPRNPILTHRDTRIETPIQATGHADWVDDAEGNEWLVFLGYRPRQGYYHHLGRETFLAPLAWDADGWPVVNSGRRIGLEMSGPLPASSPWPATAARDDFDAPVLGGEWNGLRRLDPGVWSLTERPGWLRLRGTASTLDEPGAPALLARRQAHFELTATCRLEFTPAADSDEAGLAVFMDERHHAEIALTRARGRRRVRVRWRIGSLAATLAETEAPEGPLVLSVRAEADQYHFLLGEAAEAQTLAAAETKYFSSEVAGGFTGVYLGMYAAGNGQPASAPADFDWFEYRPK